MDTHRSSLAPLPWLVYILRCVDDTLYTGITTDITRRIHEHNTDNKVGSKYARVRRPVRLVYQETYASRSEASKREAAIKKLSRQEKEKLFTTV
jgi:putative endonuclease